MKEIIPILGILGSNIFFAIITIIGFQYDGLDSSNTYMFYSIIVAIMNIGLFLKYFLFDKKSFSRKELVVLSVPLVMLVIYFSGKGMTSINVSNEFSTRYISFFLLWSMPAMLISIYVYEKKILLDLVKWIEVLGVLFTLAALITIMIPFVNGINFRVIKSNLNYQTASYLLAFAYGINLFLFFYGKKIKRFAFCESSVYRFVSYFFLFVQVATIIITGGRGGLVLCFVYTITIIFSAIIKTKKSKVKKLILIGGGFLLFIIIVFPILMQNEMFNNGFNRAIAFLGENGINWEGTSGRDNTYKRSINYTLEKPILGYGIFNVFGILKSYPHNIFLELLFGGGIFYLFSGILFLGYTVMKIGYLIKFDEANMFLLILLIYPLVMLMFSGTYIINALFWFVMSYAFLEKVNKSEKSLQKKKESNDAKNINYH